MNQPALPPAPPAVGQEAQVLFVDGHKVTIRYSEAGNPQALRAIRNVLLSNLLSAKP